MKIGKTSTENKDIGTNLYGFLIGTNLEEIKDFVNLPKHFSGSQTFVPAFENGDGLKQKPWFATAAQIFFNWPNLDVWKQGQVPVWNIISDPRVLAYSETHGSELAVSSTPFKKRTHIFLAKEKPTLCITERRTLVAARKWYKLHGSYKWSLLEVFSVPLSAPF